MRKIILIILILFLQNSFAQSNYKDIISKNNVKTQSTNYYFSNSKGSCNSSTVKFDKRGNVIESDFHRVGTIYRYLFDKNNNKTLSQWVERSDTTKIQSFNYDYDKQNNLILEKGDSLINTYDENNNLIGVLNESKNVENNTIRKLVEQSWTDFDKIKTKITMNMVIEDNKVTKYERLNVKCIEYEYDLKQNLIKETHYEDEEVINTITYKYNKLNWLIEKIEIEPSRINSINSFKFDDAEDITQLTTKIVYNANGSIKQEYAYDMDMCLSLNNHFLFKNYYKKNGLKNRIDVYENGKFLYKIVFKYEYY